MSKKDARKEAAKQLKTVIEKRDHLDIFEIRVRKLVDEYHADGLSLDALAFRLEQVAGYYTRGSAG